jgi:hypothetical protein
VAFTEEALTIRYARLFHFDRSRREITKDPALFLLWKKSAMSHLTPSPVLFPPRGRGLH